ncbi:MAG: hypothetical protein V3T88_02775 [Nitrosomonadaceae bacterium]
MKSKNDWMAWAIVIAAIMFFSYSIAIADSRRHYEITNVTSINNKCSAVSAAAGQHHYRSTNRIQWSVGGAYCDSSAASFGLGAQLGKVFASGNYSTDGHDSIIGFSLNGKF